MPNQDNKVVLINTLIDWTRFENSVSKFDILTLSQDIDVNDTGRVIAVQDAGGYSGYDPDIVSYAYFVKGSDTSLTISGNYNLNGDGKGEKEFDIGYYSDYIVDGLKVSPFFADENNAPSLVTVSTLYNAYHFAYNNDHGQENIGGALKFNGNNSLILTAQAGSKTANIYWQANDFKSTGEKRLKTDDAISLKSETYGIYTPWKHSDGKQFVYGENQGGVSAPGKTTASYTIHSIGEKLTVKSDLAGKIDSQVAALHTGYYVKNSDPTKDPVATNDSSGNLIEAAGVKVKDLVLESNFRAVVNALNNSGTLNDGLLKGQDDAAHKEKSKIYVWNVDKVTTPGTGEGGSGGSTEKVLKKGSSTTAKGTTISGFAAPTANDNRIFSYGVVADNSVTLGDGVWSTLIDGVWSGEINAEVSNVLINANYKNVASVDREGVAASATGNEVGAYGIKASTVNIDKMGALHNDYDGVSSDGMYASSISAVANNIKVSAIASIKPGEGESKPTPSSANTGIDITAAAIWADSVNIGEMTSDFSLYAESTGGYAEAKVDVDGGIVDGNSAHVTAEASVYGIKATSVSFGIFEGSITAKSDLTFDCVSVSNGTLPGSYTANSVAMGIAARSLTASRKFAGKIDATHLGISTGGNFKVTGVIATDIKASAVGIYTLGNLTADAFTGNIAGQEISYGNGLLEITEKVLHVGISVSGSISSNNNAKGDAFDVAGNIKVVGEDWSEKYSHFGDEAKRLAAIYQVEGYGIASMSALNLRISGTIDAGIYTAVIAERFYNELRGWETGSKYNDRVELAATAKVTGDINLGQLANQFIINSSAEFDGIVYAEGGSVNTTFILDDKIKANHVTYKIDSYHPGDTMIKGSQLININMSYAVDGTYDLIQYGYHTFKDDTGVEQKNLWKYWQNNEFQLNYLDKSYNVKFDTHNDSTHSHSGSVTINDGKGHDLTFTVTYTENEDLLSVTVNGMENFEYVPEQLGVTGKADTYVTTTAADGKFTVDWSELDSYLKANIESTLSGEDTYGLGKVTNYSIRYKFVDFYGNDLPIAGENGDQIWTELEFYEVKGTKLTLDNVPEGAENVIWKITPVDDTIYTVEDKEARKLLETTVEDGKLVISWEKLEPEDAGLAVDKNENDNKKKWKNSGIDLVEIVYTIYGRNGKVTGSANQSKFITLDEYIEYMEDGFTFADEEAGSRIKWDIKFHDVKNATDDRGDDFAFDNESVVKVYTQQYDAEKSQLSVNWKELHDSLTKNGGLADFNFANGILNYELEYQLYDKEGKTIGDTIVVTLDKNTYKYTFNGVEENAKLDWRIRIVGNETGGLVSKWSVWNNVEVKLLDSEGFNFDNFTSQVRSIYSTVADNAVPNSIAELSWDDLESAKAVRCYEIQYIRSVKQVSLADAKEAGFDSVDEYIVSDKFLEDYAEKDADGNPVYYTKVVSGKSVVLSNLKNNGYIYWKIRAIDETAYLGDALDGVVNINNPERDTQGVSEWVAGTTFCVHQNGETIAPDMQRNQKLGIYFDVDKPMTFNGNSDIVGYLCWNNAVEQDSGMRDYVVEFRNQAGTVVATKTVQAADATTRCIGEWTLGEGILNDGEYTATVDGETGEVEVKAVVLSEEVDVELADGTVEKQTKYTTVLRFTTNIELTEKSVITFKKDGVTLNPNGVYAYDSELSEADNAGRFTFSKFDFELSLDDIDKDFDPSKGYSYSITATDNFNNSNKSGVSTIIGNFDVDKNPPVFMKEAQSGHFVSNKLSDNPLEETLLNGFICWDGAFDGETDILRYVLTLMDDKGNVLVDRDGKECIEIIDQTNDPTRVMPVSRTIVTIDEERANMPLGQEYIITDEAGKELKCEYTIKEVTVTDENGEPKTMVRLQFTVEGDYNGKKVFINGNEKLLNDNNRKFYEYSIDFSQWNLDAPRYTYSIYAEDSLGNRTPVALKGGFVLDDQSPVFSDESTGVTGLTFNKPADDDFESLTGINGKILWNAATDDYGIKEYIIEISTDGKTYSEFTRVSADNMISGISQVAWQSSELELDGTYTITIDGVEYAGRVEKRSNGKTLIWDGEGDWTGKTAVISGNGKEWTITMDAANCSINIYKYAAELKDLTGKLYKYRIKAVDFMGNGSNYIYGKDIVADRGVPEFTEESALVSVKYSNDKTSIVPTVTWDAAEDAFNDLGVRYYAIFVAEVDSPEDIVSNWGDAVMMVDDNGSASYSATLDELALKPGIYRYKVVAYDYFGNTAELTGNFSTPDEVGGNGPVGSFAGYNPKVTANFTVDELQVPKYDDKGKPVKDDEGNQEFDTVYQKNFIDAEVVIDWSDTFTNAAHYKVVISSDPDFVEGSELYSFWTTAEEAADTKMVFNAATTGRPVGIFEDMETVYYRIFAYDASYRKAAASSGLQEFKFFDDRYGEKIVETKWAVPQNVTPGTNNMVEGCHTDEVSLSWTTSGSQLGVYYYEVELLDATGKKVIKSETTLDAVSDKLVTDSKPSNKFYTITVGADNTKVEISDLKKFLGMTALDDGTYKVRVNAYAADNTKNSSVVKEFVVDTQRPDPVKVTKFSMIPSGISDEDQLNVLMVEWEKAANPAEIEAYVVYWRIGDSGEWKECRINDGNATSIAALPNSQWPEVNFTSTDQSCEFYVVAIDKQDNVSEWLGDNLEIAMTEDKFANSRENASELVKVVGKEDKVFADLSRIEAGDIVGVGDFNDYFIVTTDQAAALNLTVSELAAVINGATDDIKIVIYEGNSTKAFKTVTVKDAGNVFSGLLLKANTSYTFNISSVNGKKAASRYNLVLDKKELPTDNGESVPFNNTGNSGWVGFGDTSDRYDLTLTKSGKYTFTIGDAAAGVKLAVYEYEEGSKKALATISASEKNIGGVTTKELLLDDSKEYYVEVTISNTKVSGTGYSVSMNTIETYPGTADDYDDGISINNTPEISVTGSVSGEWVGFGDEKDYRVLKVGANGAVVDFTVTHTADSDEAVKVVIYQFDENKNLYKSFKTVTLAKKSGSVSTGNLYLTGEYGGTYYVEIAAPGAAKGQNSSYELKTNGYLIADDMLSDTLNNTPDGATALTDGAGWVGVGDTVDNYSFALTEADAGAYEFKLAGVNGKEIKAAVGYLKDGKFTALKSENGVAGADELILSLDITADMINAANGQLYVQVSANGKNANSMYSLTAEKLQFTDPGTLSVGASVSSKVGLGDANKVDKIELAITESGFYDLAVSGAENPLAVQLVEVDANDKSKNIKNISLTAANSDGVISGVFLDQSKTYKLFVTATGAAKGKNSNYSVALESQTEKLLSNQAGGKIYADNVIDAYAYTVSNPGVYSFVLNGNNIKMSIIDAATGNVVKSITPGAKSNQAALSLKFDAAGDYIVKLEAAGKAKESGYELEVIDRAGEFAGDYSTWTWSESNKSNGWVGLEDSEDWYYLEIGATGIYDLTLNNLDNNAKVTVYENGKSIGSVSGTGAKDGMLNGLLLDEGIYIVQVKAGSSNGTKDTDYSLILEQRLASKVDGDTLAAPSVTGVQNWVGFGDSKDFYTFTAGDVNNITVNLGEEKGDVKVVITTLDGTKVVTVKTLTVNGKTWTASSGDLCLVNGQTYNIEVSAVKANKGVYADYTLSVDQWIFADYEAGKTADDSLIGAGLMTFDEKGKSAISTKNAVWSGDKVDYFKVVVAEDGSYTLNAGLESLNGNAVKISIGTEKNGKFSSLQSVTGKAGSDVLQLSRNLAAGTYFIKVESNGKNSAAEYTVSLTNNNNRANDVFSNADDNWKAVAGEITNEICEVGKDAASTLSNWVGFGDSVDVFELKFSENGVVSLDWNGDDALLNKEIALTLMDANGKSVALTFDKETGIYTSKNILMADSEYYLSVTNKKSNQNNIDYKIDITLA